MDREGLVATRWAGRGGLRRTLPLVIGLAVVLALGALSLLLGQASLQDAQRTRLAERVHLTRQVGSFVTTVYDPVKLREAVARSPFSPDQPALDELLLQQFQVTATGDPNEIVILFDRSGRPIASRPTGADLTVGDLGDSWARALGGAVAQTPVFLRHGRASRAFAVPVTRAGSARPWAVLVTVPREVSGQQFQEELRSVGERPGGLSSADPLGISLTSWNPALTGTRIISERDAAALRTDPERIWLSGRGSARTVNIASVDPNSGYSELFQQRTSDLYADLRSAQQRRDLTLLAVMFAAVAGLVMLGLRRERAARRAAGRLHALLKNAHDLVVVVADDGRTGFVSPAIEDLLGHDPGHWTGRSIGDLVHPGDRDRLAAVLAEPGAGRLLNVRLFAADGSVRWFDVEGRDLLDEPELDGVLLTCHEVGQRKLLQDQLTFAASHDLVTELPNRAVFIEQLDRAVAAGTGIGALAVLFIDLDHFKPVNDSFGHEAGDGVLRTAAARIAGAVREQDVVCRFGGDEFGVFIPGADEALARDVADRIVRAIQAPIAVDDTLVHIDASVGVTLVQRAGDAESAEQLIREADAAMYEAKRAGRGRHHVHTGPPLTLTSASGPSARRLDAAPPQAPFPAPRLAADSALAATRPPAGWQARLAQLVPLLVALALVLGIASTGAWQEARARDTAAANRVAERSQLAARIAEYSASVTSPDRIAAATAQAPWNLSDLSRNEIILESFGRSTAAGPNSVIALTRPDGTVGGIYPAGARVSLPADDPAWALARSGRPGLSRVVDPESATPRGYYVIPILSRGTVAAILLIGASSHDSVVSKLTQAVGSLGFGAGGLALVDATGRVYVAWDPAVIGSAFVTPADVSGLSFGQVRRVTRGGQTYLITDAFSPGDPNPRYGVFRQPTKVLFGDSTHGANTRNALLVAIVGAAVLGLAILNRRRERAVRRSEARLHALLHNAHDIVIAVNPAGVATFVSSAMTGLLGQDAAAWVGRPLLDLVDDEDRARLARVLSPAVRAAADIVIPEVRLRTSTGGTRWFDVAVADLRANPAVRGLLLTCHETAERKELQQQLSHRARYDLLTGLPNRATLAAHLETITATGDTGPFAVLFVDLDHFKPVNDTYGHDAGDWVLQTIAARLLAAVRCDESRERDLVCRLGGDEFAVVLRDVDNLLARLVADRLLDAVRLPLGLAGATVVIGATIGIAFSHPDNPRPGSLVRDADTAMYQAKQAGRGRYAVFSG